MNGTNHALELAGVAGLACTPKQEHRQLHQGMSSDAMHEDRSWQVESWGAVAVWGTIEGRWGGRTRCDGSRSERGASFRACAGGQRSENTLLIAFPRFVVLHMKEDSLFR